MTYRYWTSEEEETLRSMAKDGATLFEICKSIDRTPMAVILRTRRLSGLELPDTYGRLSDDYFDPTKTLQEEYHERGRRWEMYNNKILIDDFYNGHNIFQIGEKLQRPPRAIISQIKKLNDSPLACQALFERAASFFRLKRI